MKMIEATKMCLGKYAKFSGRASRPEYWWFVLFVILGSILMTIIDAAVFGTDPETGEVNTILAPVFHIAIFLPGLAAGWRRMHDSGRPGWYILVPMAVSTLFAVSLFIGVFVFGFAENHGVDLDALRGSATVLTIAGLVVFGLVQLALLGLMIWWLTRPSDDGINDYGPRPSF